MFISLQFWEGLGHTTTHWRSGLLVLQSAAATVTQWTSATPDQHVLACFAAIMLQNGWFPSSWQRYFILNSFFHANATRWAAFSHLWQRISVKFKTCLQLAILMWHATSTAVNFSRDARPLYWRHVTGCWRSHNTAILPSFHAMTNFLPSHFSFTPMLWNMSPLKTG